MSRYEIEKQKWNDKSSTEQQSDQALRYTKNYQSVFSTRNALRPAQRFFTRIAEPGISVLDYGCGNGWTSLALATVASSVSAFDISEGRISVFNKRIAYNGIKNIETLVCNGESLPYADNSFDYVFGNAVLHHITLDKCLPEISRVLKPGGRAAFSEPLAHNPLVNSFRYLKHHYLEKHVGTDRPLRYSDIPTFNQYFSKVEFCESSFLRDRYPVLGPWERKLLKIPWLRRYVCYVTVLLEQAPA